LPTREELDTKARADRLLRSGNHAEALVLYRTLLVRVSAFEPGLYESWLDGAMAAFRLQGAKREVGCIQLALRRFSEAQKSLDPTVDPVAWSLAMSRQGFRKEAAVAMESAGFLVMAARELEASEDNAGALHLWERISRAPSLRGRRYETALVKLLKARVELRLGNADAATKLTNEGVSQLEALADSFEARGQRDRAFDCYLLLLRVGLGQHEGFENLAEGYLNAIRILVADGQCDLALQYFDEFITAAADRKEFHAAATVAMDAADFCRRSELGYEGLFLRRGVDMWMKAAALANSQFDAPELAQNALCAALDAATSTGDLALVGQVYGALALLPLDATCVARYVTLSQRYSRSNTPSPHHETQRVLPFSSKREEAYQDIAWQDLIEWEFACAVEPTLALIVVERTDHLRFSRAALFALLLAVGNPQWRTDAIQSCSIAKSLGDVEVYEVLSPLERIAMDDSADVRSAAMAAVGRVLCKRSFATIRQGLQDPNEQVKTSARQALQGLHFRDGLDCLWRIYRETVDPAVREAALRAVAKVPTLAATVILLDVILEEEGALQRFAAECLTTFPDSGLEPYIRAKLEAASPGAREALVVVLNAIAARKS